MKIKELTFILSLLNFLFVRAMNLHGYTREKKILCLPYSFLNLSDFLGQQCIMCIGSILCKNGLESDSATLECMF